MAFAARLSLLVLWEGFETIILPRRITRRFRLTRLFYRRSWLPYGKLVTGLVPARRQETWLSFFGPSSLLLLLSFWASDRPSPHHCAPQHVQTVSIGPEVLSIPQLPAP